MGATLVQQAAAADNSGNGTSVTVTLSQTPANGNTLVLLATNGSTAGTGQAVSSVSGGGVSWTKAVAINNPNGHDDEIWYGTVSGGTTTVTFTIPSAKPLSAVVAEWSGLSALDATGSSEQATSTMGSGTVTTTKANDLIIGCAANTNGVRTGNAASPAVDLTGTSPAYIGTAYLVAGSAGQYGITWTLTEVSNWEGVVAAFTVAQGTAYTMGASPGTYSPAGSQSVAGWSMGDASGAYMHTGSPAISALTARVGAGTYALVGAVEGKKSDPPADDYYIARILRIL